MKGLGTMSAIMLSGLLFWFFNIKSKNKCITLTPKCDSTNTSIEILKFE